MITNQSSPNTKYLGGLISTKEPANQKFTLPALPAITSFFSKNRTSLEKKPNSINLPKLSGFFGSYKTLKPSDQRPSLLNGREITEIFQFEMAFTNAVDEKPLLATYGCHPCVAVALYDPTNKIAFLAHFACPREVISCKPLLLYTFSRLAKNPFREPIQMHIRAAFGFSTTQETIDAIKALLIHRADLPITLASEETTSFEAESLLIDARDGSVTSYNCLQNPQRRHLTEKDELRCLRSALHPHVDLIYQPKIDEEVNAPIIFLSEEVL